MSAADLTQSLRTTGRAAEPVVAKARRSLSAADLAVLDQPRPSAEPPDLKRITERHHLLARSLAAGMSVTEAAVRTGISVNRVSILQGDPALSDLIAHYRKQADAAFGDLQARLAGLAGDAVDLLADRLEAAPESFDIGALIEVGKFAADRSGHGPSTKSQVDIRVGLAERLESARKRIANGPLVIDAVAIGFPPNSTGERND